MDNGTNGDRVAAIFVGDDHGLLGDSANAHDGGVGLIDDGQAEDGAELTGIGNGEGRALDVGGHELFSAGALAEVGDSTLEAEEVELVGSFEDGHDESPVEGDGDAGIDVLVIADAIAFEGGVDDGELLKGDDGGTYKKGHEGEAGAMALLEGIFEFVAEVDDAGHVDLEHAVDVSAGAARLDHALSDDFAHLGHRNEVTGNGSGRRGRRRPTQANTGLGWGTRRGG